MRSAWLAALLLVAACAKTPERAAENFADEAPEAGSAGGLPGWGEDRLADWAEAWQRSCRRQPWKAAAGGLSAAARAAWQCRCAEPVPSDGQALRAWLETGFRSERVAGQALVTGYFEPTLHGRRQPEGAYTTPLYRMPQTRPGEGPLPARAAIDAGALAGRGLEIAWVDPVDAFFLHIQGSGTVLLPGEAPLRLGYAGDNGHPYRAIGRDLVELGELAREQVSMQSIEAWLRVHPTRAVEIMQRNRRYIFFRTVAGPGPVGAQGVALTPERSLAVDPGETPYGLPVWLDLAAGHGVPAIRRLTVAQDTGSAIRGAARGDFFWGSGERAAAMAGRMQSRGTLYRLIPQWRTESDQETRSCSKS